jgi:hypothetical protein
MNPIILGALVAAFILAATCIIFWKSYPKEMQDLECSNCFCNDTCKELSKREEKKPSGRKFFVED